MLLFALQIAVPPLGSNPSTWDAYHSHIDNTTDTFTCLDNSTTIPLSQFNDGWLDCPDGSDEPSTGANPNSTFFCVNEWIHPMKLQSWLVGDGVCDCCDGADEAFNPHANCTNTCSNLTALRKNLTTELRQRFTDGLKVAQKLNKSGRKILESKYRKKFVDIPTSVVEKVLRLLEIEDLNGSTKATTRGYPDWADPLVLLWKYTFFVEQPVNAFIPVVRKCAIWDLRRLKIWLQDKKAQAYLADTPELVIPAAVPLFAESFKKEKYEVRLLKDVMKDNVTLAKFKNITDDVMWFDSGPRCPKGKGRRNLRLELVCSNVTELLSADTPDQCGYTGVLATPVVCNESLIEGLDSFKLKKIERLATALELPLPD
jgi:hypothetical protein